MFDIVQRYLLPIYLRCPYLTIEKYILCAYGYVMFLLLSHQFVLIVRGTDLPVLTRIASPTFIWLLKCLCSNPGALFIQWKNVLSAYRKISWSLEDARFELDFLNRSEICQTPRQQRYRAASQILKRYDNRNIQSRDFETLRDLAVRRLTAWWIEALHCFIDLYMTVSVSVR